MTLVASVNAIQPLIVLVFVIILGLFMPGILKEEKGKETLVFKFAGTILVIMGMLLPDPPCCNLSKQYFHDLAKLLSLFTAEAASLLPV